MKKKEYKQKVEQMDDEQMLGMISLTNSMEIASVVDLLIKKKLITQKEFEKAMNSKNKELNDTVEKKKSELGNRPQRIYDPMQNYIG